MEEHITLAERDRIARLKWRVFPHAAIAEVLGRSKDNRMF
jgi:hypothetical protein